MNHWIKKMAPGLAGIVLTAPVLTNPVLADTDYSEIRRDVEVMSRALLAAGRGEKGMPSISRIEGNYLAGQGIVLSLSAHRLGHHGAFPSFHGGDFEAFGEDIEVFVEDILSEVEISLEGLDETLAGLDLGDLEKRRVIVLDDEEMEAMRDDMRRELHGVRDEVRAEVRELRKEQASVRREYAEAQREYERSLDAYEEKLEAGVAKAEAQSAMEQAEAAMAAARESYRKGRSAYQEKVEAAREEQRAERRRKIEAFATATLDNFCRYGTSLRSLPGDEHITLVFDGMGGDDPDEDLIYVIEKKDHSACLTGDIESTQLAERAVSYRF